MRKFGLILFVLASIFVSTITVDAAQIVVLGPNEEVYSYKEFEANKGETVFSALQRTGLKFDYIENSANGLHGYYVSSINGCGEHNACQGWNFYVEGVHTGDNASNEQLVFNNDKIVWLSANRYGKYSYKFPESNKTIVESNDKSVDDVISEVLNKNTEELENKNEQETTDSNIQDKKEDISGESAGDRSEEKEYEKYIDYRNLGCIGIVICFILFISYYKLVRKGE